MTEHPILFSAPMVRAILGNLKTQTRRVVINKLDVCDACWGESTPHNGEGTVLQVHKRSPYLRVGFCEHNDRAGGRPYAVWEKGDVLWVRETWRTFNNASGVVYRATDVWADNGERWHPSIYMPRQCCRITLEVTDVRVQRVQEITEEDALAEGLSLMKRPPGYGPGYFPETWDAINKKRGYGWEVNPWVWAISFRRVA